MSREPEPPPPSRTGSPALALDPFDFTAEDVAIALRLRPHVPHDTLALLVSHEIDGRGFLTELNTENLRDEIGIAQFGRRLTIMRIIDEWRLVSPKYKEFIAARPAPAPEPTNPLISYFGEFKPSGGPPPPAPGRNEGLRLLDREKALLISDPFKNSSGSVAKVTGVEEDGTGVLDGSDVGDSDADIEQGSEQGSDVEMGDHSLPPAAEGEATRTLGQVLARPDGGQGDGAGPSAQNVNESPHVWNLTIDPDGRKRLTFVGTAAQQPEVDGPPSTVTNSEQPQDNVIVGADGKKRLKVLMVVKDGATLLAEKEAEREANRRSEQDREEEDDNDVLQPPILQSQSDTHPTKTRRRKHRYLGKKARKIDTLFYDVEVGEEIVDVGDVDDNFFYCRDYPPGERQYVARQMKRFHMRLDEGIGRLDTQRIDGHPRTAIMYHERLDLLKKWERLSFTVFDVDQVRRQNTDTLKLPWPEKWDANAPSPDDPNPFKAPTNPNEITDWDYLLKWNNVEGANETWDVDNDSLPGDYDEVEGGENEDGTSRPPKIGHKNPALTPEQVQQAVEEGIDEVIRRWKQKTLPRLEATRAYKLWTKAKNQKRRKPGIIAATRRIKELTTRLEKQKKETFSAGIRWTSDVQIKKICRGNMSATIEDIEHEKWVIDVLKRKDGPPKPLAKSKKIPAGGAEEEIVEDGSDGESLGGSEIDEYSDDDDLDGFIVPDEEVDDQLKPAEDKPEETADDMELDELDNDSDSEQTGAISKPKTPKPRKPRASSQITMIDLADDEEETEQQPPKTQERKPPGTLRVTDDGKFEIDLTQDSPPASPKVRKGSAKAPINIDDEVLPSFRRAKPNPERNACIQQLLESLTLEEFKAIDDNVTPWTEEQRPPPQLLKHIQFAFTILPDPLGALRAKIKHLDAQGEVAYRLISRCYVAWRERKLDVPPDFKIQKTEWARLQDTIQLVRFMIDLQKVIQEIRERREEDSDGGQESGADGKSTGPPKRRRPVKEDAGARDKRNRQANIESQIEQRYKEQQRRMKELGSQRQGVIVNIGHEDKYPDIMLHEFLAQRLKPHQVEGVQFMWRQLITIGENRGGLLAHTMGLGKTLQVIALLHTIANAAKSEDPAISDQIPEHMKEDGLFRAIVLCPPGIVENWWEEFHKWWPIELDADNVATRWKLTGELRRADGSLDLFQRRRNIKAWADEGGILLMGYALFRGFVFDSKKKKSPEPIIGKRGLPLKQKPRKLEPREVEFAKYRDLLLKKASIIVADEAHTLKNPLAGVTRAAMQFKSTSRIALTGSPLSNNLEEYWSMIEWVDPGYLGPLKEFRGKYVIPIQDGMYSDSSRQAKRRSMKMLRVLTSVIAPKVHRADINVLKDELPQKTEFIIKIPLTDAQLDFYRRFIADVRVSVDGLTATKASSHTALFGVAYLMGAIVSHPNIFVDIIKTREKNIEKNKDTLKKTLPVAAGGDGDEDFIIDEDVDSEAVLEAQRLLSSEALSADNNPHPWIDELVDKYGNALALSSRMMAFKTVIDMSVAIGDQVLVFCHGLKTLNALEAWIKEWGVSVQRMDGSTPASARQSATRGFHENKTSVFLISTEAGGLGLNLPCANRVIIFDFKWSPVWEQQAVGRAYRFGQKKHVYVYRFLSGGTFEEVLWNLALFKEQLQSRVVDSKAYSRSAVKAIHRYLEDPRETEKKTNLKAELSGKDPILDALLEEEWIYDVQQTDTFAPDEEGELTKDEVADTEAEIEEARRARQARLVAEAQAKEAMTKDKLSALRTNAEAPLASLPFSEAAPEDAGPSTPTPQPTRPATFDAKLMGTLDMAKSTLGGGKRASQPTGPDLNNLPKDPQKSWFLNPTPGASWKKGPDRPNLNQPLDPQKSVLFRKSISGLSGGESSIRTNPADEGSRRASLAEAGSDLRNRGDKGKGREKEDGGKNVSTDAENGTERRRESLPMSFMGPTSKTRPP